MHDLIRDYCREGHSQGSLTSLQRQFVDRLLHEVKDDRQVAKLMGYTTVCLAYHVRQAMRGPILSDPLLQLSTPNK